VFILNVLKVLCFDTLLQVFILKVFTLQLFVLLGDREREGHEERTKAKREGGAAACNANTQIGASGLVSAEAPTSWVTVAQPMGYCQ
jgi:hypothetical protein